MYWFGAESLLDANAYYCSEQARMLVIRSPSPVRWLVVDTGAITGIDYTAGNMLRELQRDLAKRGVVLALTRVSDSLKEDLRSRGTGSRHWVESHLWLAERLSGRVWRVCIGCAVSELTQS